MVRRQRAAQAVVDRFLHTVLAFGERDCIRLGATALREMGRPAGLTRAGSYSTLLGATRAMKRAGFADLVEAVDAQGLERIAPAAALPADLVMLPAEAPFGGALTMAVGNGRVIGWHDDVDTAEILQPIAYIAAWRL